MALMINKKRRFLVFIAALLVLVSGLMVFNALRHDSFQSMAKSIKVGDTKEQVERVLGRATQVFAPKQDFIFGRPRETWAYGSKIQQFRYAFSSEFPYFSPFRFRLFGPDDDDIAVEFDTKGRVFVVKIPKQK
ncbi:MAG: hypothetical protein JWM68_3699 [Verrucomicrobiales bacterium]|nr:hypothetical protein [Verrucomicrobiales bacterium]